MVQVHNYDNVGRPSRDILEKSLLQLSNSLQLINRSTIPAGPPTGNTHIDRVAGKGTNLASVPTEILHYVDNGRNPDIYTREFVELARKNNQLMRGKMQAFGSFRDVIAGEMEKVFPELGEDIKMVVEATTDKREGNRKTVDIGNAGIMRLSWAGFAWSSGKYKCGTWGLGAIERMGNYTNLTALKTKGVSVQLPIGIQTNQYEYVLQDYKGDNDGADDIIEVLAPHLLILYTIVWRKKPEAIRPSQSPKYNIPAITPISSLQANL
ncbi:hypothetical protein EYC84_007744 [Monilinia fructicola]|nr:hypothetical protein EYC84_007744 [Monilinia fructicola]